MEKCMEQIILRKNECTGCRACEQICPVSCIKLVPDSEGFIYPEIDSEKCIKCKKCENKCHMLHKPVGSENKSGFYGRNNELLFLSSSGGAFSTITEEFLDDRGKVFGAVFSDDFKYVRHVSADKFNYQSMRKSKYVFSDPCNSFSEAKKFLENGVKVLFSGTPCQIAGLKTFLGKKYDNLITVDFICHGTPSIRFYQDHVSAISNGQRITNVDFRSKYFGWREYCLKVETERKKYIKPVSEDYYIAKFMTNDVLRKCCYDCHYSNGFHQSDITLGDYWKLNKYYPDRDDDKGMSLVIANTDKGRQIVQQVSGKLSLTPINYEEFSYVYKKHNYSIIKREAFMKEYSKYGYEEMRKKWWNKNRFKAIKKRIKIFLKKIK